jgi:hypothetical protein
MVIISYNEAMDMEVMEVIDSSGVKGYSKINGTFGKGTLSGTHLGDDIFPGRNNMLFIACEDTAAVKKILAGVAEIRSKLSHEGIKAFVLPLEESN